MLPILPAILLLFLQGPANIERLAHEGRLPAAIEAVHSDDRAIAALLAASHSELSHALLALIDWSESESKPIKKQEISTFVAIVPHPITATSSGFTTSQRSRDGPVLVV